jgi:chromosome segregation ATPase
MSEIEDLRQRLTAAFDRIAAGLDGLDGPVAAEDHDALMREAAEARSAQAAMEAEMETLRAAIEEERTANQQLEERLRTLRSRQDDQIADLREQVGVGREGLVLLDKELQRLRSANETLEATAQELTRALSDNVSDPEMIDRAMLAELESIRAARAVDEAEARAVLGALGPLLAEAASNSQPTEASGGRGEAATEGDSR